jgi:putative photosynthetic complex assembly protein
MSGVAAGSDTSLRWPLLGVAVMLASTLAMVALARLQMPATNHVQVTTRPGVPPLAARLMRFEDRVDGGVDVIDAAGGDRIAVIAPGSDGFVRGVLRALSRERMQRGVGSDPAFRLIEYADAGMWIEDTATGRAISLNAFGQTNVAAFQRLLRQQEIKP